MTSLISNLTSAIIDNTSSIISDITTSTPTSISTSISTTTLPSSTSITSIPPSTTTVPPSSSIAPTTIITSITSVVTETPSGSSQAPIITTIYSTQPIVTFTPSASSASTRSSSSSSSTPTALTADGGASASKGLSNGATIAIAVIIPIAAVIGLVVLGIWFWRRRKAKKNAEELRKNEMAEYGFNPNQDPTLPVAYTDGGSDGNDDSGYRGWGATSSTARKPSTTMGSNSRAAAMAGVAASDSGSHGYVQPSPNAPSDDPLVGGYTDGTAGGLAAGAAAGAAKNRYSQASGIQRGPSNASSQYSNAGPAMSEGESEHVPADYYNNEVPYNIYNDVQQPSGPYGQQGDQPVIRDVQARRNTRIERAPTFPQQGGIAQNF